MVKIFCDCLRFFFTVPDIPEISSEIASNEGDKPPQPDSSQDQPEQAADSKQLSSSY